MNMHDVAITKEELLDKKRDYSPFLVHLTKDSKDISPDGKEQTKPAMINLEWILYEKELKALNHFCYFSPALNDKSEIPSIKDKFRVVCFTETPIDQIGILLNKVFGRRFEPEPYGLVFQKSYIKENGGNPVFYVTKEIARPLMDIIYKDYVTGNENVHDGICKLLALITVCEEGNDFHWEREWRTVGNLKFELSEVYCGLCPDNLIEYFKNKYSPVKFISPYWGINKILDELVRK